MSGKLLFVSHSGPESHYNVLWGLRMAKNTWTHPYGEKMLDDVKVLLFGRGVGIINPKLAESLGVKLVHASQYVAEKVSEGYTVMNF